MKSHTTGSRRAREAGRGGTAVRFALAALATALLAPGVASANPAFEPNDGIHQAYGPLAAGSNYDATISSSSDSDWYIVYVSGQGVLSVEMTNFDQNTCCATPSVYLRNHDGETLNSTSVDEGDTETIPYTTQGPGHYYIEVRGGLVPDTYRLRVNGPITSGPPPGAAQQTPNASREYTSAFGPLAGGTLYGGSIDANGEEDWFFFNTSGPGEFDIALTNIDDGECCGTPSMYLYDHEGVEQGSSINSTSADRDQIAHIRFTGPGPQQYFLRISGGVPVDRYQFIITPAGLLTPETPAAATEACQKAQAKLAKKKEKLQQAKFDKQNAFSKKERKKAKKKLKKARKKVKKAKKQVKKFC